MAVLGYGHALWYYARFFNQLRTLSDHWILKHSRQPAPTPDYDCVSIGDVGYIHEGQFIRLFSACSPPQEVSDYTGESDPPLQYTSEVPTSQAPCCLHTSTVRKLGRIAESDVDGFSTLCVLLIAPLPAISETCHPDPKAHSRLSSPAIAVQRWSRRTTPIGKIAWMALSLKTILETTTRVGLDSPVTQRNSRETRSSLSYPVST